MRLSSDLIETPPLAPGALVFTSSGLQCIVGANAACPECKGKGFAFLRAKLTPRRIAFTWKRCFCAPRGAA